MANQWYAFYPGDYARDTAHLSLLEHGAYRLLLDYFYSTGRPIPVEKPGMMPGMMPGLKGGIYRVCRAVTSEEQAAVDSVLGQFFTLTPEGWINERASIEIDKQNIHRERLSASGKKGAAVRESRRVASYEASSGASCLEHANHNHNHNKEGLIEGASEPMRLSEFSKLYRECIGVMMPGGLNHEATELCKRIPPERIREAFHLTAERGGKSLAYMKTILEPEKAFRDNKPAKEKRKGETRLERNMEAARQAGKMLGVWDEES